MVEEKDSIATRGVHLNGAEEPRRGNLSPPLFFVSVDSNGDESVYFQSLCLQVLILEELEVELRRKD
jgi:hypothetical protein